MEKPVRVTRYEKEVWETPAMDTLRRMHCMCLFCKRLKPMQEDNCKIAQSFFDICKENGNAMIMTRCPIWVDLDSEEEV